MNRRRNVNLFLDFKKVIHRIESLIIILIFEKVFFERIGQKGGANDLEKVSNGRKQVGVEITLLSGKIDAMKAIKTVIFFEIRNETLDVLSFGPHTVFLLAVGILDELPDIISAIKNNSGISFFIEKVENSFNETFFHHFLRKSIVIAY